MSTDETGLSTADADLLQAMTEESNHTVAVIELLRKRAEGMLVAAQLLREQGAHGHEVLKRAVSVAANIVNAENARSELTRVAEYADDTTNEFMRAYCVLIEAAHVVRQDLLALCFIDDTASVRRDLTRASNASSASRE